MTDIDDRESAVPEPFHNREESLGVVFGEGARGLVKDNDSGTGNEGPRYLNQLLRSHAQVADPGFRPDVGMIEKRQCFGDHLRCSPRRISPARTRS